MFKSTDAGQNWVGSNTGFTSEFVNAVAIDKSNSQNLFSGTWLGLFKSTDAGQNWTEINTGLKDPIVNVLAVVPADTQSLWAGTDGKGVIRTIDGGENRSSVNTGLANQRVQSLAVNLIDDLWYAGANASSIFTFQSVSSGSGSDGGCFISAITDRDL